MTLRKGLPAKNAATDADDTRLVFRNLFACDASGQLPWSGVTSPVGVALVSSTTGMNVTIAPFNAVVKRDGGVVLLANEGPGTAKIEVAPASNKRIDVICARQNDSSSTVTTPDKDNEAGFIVITGKSDVSPVKPVVPEGSLELATVLVPAGVTATNAPGVIITQTAQFAAAAGGKLPVRSVTERNALRPFQGMQVLNLATGASEQWFDAYSSTNLAGATPPGWYSQPGTVLAAKAIQNINYLPPATATPLPGLSLPLECDGLPLRIEVVALVANPGSGANRYINLELLADGVLVGKKLAYSLPMYPSAGPAVRILHIVTASLVKGSHTLTLRLQADVVGAAQVLEVEIRAQHEIVRA